MMKITPSTQGVKTPRRHRVGFCARGYGDPVRPEGSASEQIEHNGCNMKTMTSRIHRENQLAIERAQARADAIKRELISKHLWITASELADAMGQSDQELRSTAVANGFFTLQFFGETYYPAFFADFRYPSPPLGRVIDLLKDESDWSKWVFFCTHRPSLGDRTAVEALREGDGERVAVAAAAYIEH